MNFPRATSPRLLKQDLTTTNLSPKHRSLPGTPRAVRRARTPIPSFISPKHLSGSTFNNGIPRTTVDCKLHSTQVTPRCSLWPPKSDEVNPGISSSIQTGQVLNSSINAMPSFSCSLDFTRPDALRGHVLVAESRSLYVDDYYLAIWSPILKDLFFDGSRVARSPPGGSTTAGGMASRKERQLPRQRFSHVLELLECIYPMQKEISENNLEVLLPLVYEYQISGLGVRCIDYMKGAKMKLIDKLLLADRYGLEAMISFCIRQLRLPSQIDFHSAQYAALTDKTKVRVLEKIHNPDSERKLAPHEEAILDLNAEEEANMLNLTKFLQASELFFGVIKSRGGRIFHCNPYYLAAWSNTIHEQVVTMNIQDINTNLSDDELVHFLLAVHPPTLKVTDANVHALLRAACKLDAPGLLRKTSEHLLSRAFSISLFDKLSMFDRCYLHELLEPCLRSVTEYNALLALVIHPTYDCLSTKARASILDRLSGLVKQNGHRPHLCDKCGRSAACRSIKWVCPHCGGYCTEYTV